MRCRNVTFTTTLLVVMSWPVCGWTQIEPIPNPLPDPTPAIVPSTSDGEIMLLDEVELEPTPADPKQAPPSASSEVRPVQAEQSITADSPIVPIPSVTVGPTDASPPSSVAPPADPSAESSPAYEDSAPFYIEPTQPPITYETAPAQPSRLNYGNAPPQRPTPAQPRVYQYSANGRVVQSVPQPIPPSAASSRQPVRIYQQVDAFGRPRQVIIVQRGANAASPANYYQGVPSGYARTVAYGATTAYRPTQVLVPVPTGPPAAYVYGTRPGSVAMIAIPVTVEAAPFVPGRPIMNAIRSRRY